MAFQEEKRKIDFQDGHHGSQLGFLIRKILAIFDLPVSPMLPTKFQVSWPFGSGEEAENRFSRWPPSFESWISNRNNFSYFWSTSVWCFLSRFESVGLSVQEKWKIDFKDGRFPIGMILFFGSTSHLMLPTKFRVNWPFSSGEEVKNRFSAMVAILDFLLEWF